MMHRPRDRRSTVSRYITITPDQPDDPATTDYGEADTLGSLDIPRPVLRPEDQRISDRSSRVGDDDRGTGLDRPVVQLVVGGFHPEGAFIGGRQGDGRPLVVGTLGIRGGDRWRRVLDDGEMMLLGASSVLPA
jgi:hypothetical protein